MIRVQCNSCGHTWDYKGDKDVTSCPNCGNRKRINPPRRINTPAGDTYMRGTNQPPQRYY